MIVFVLNATLFLVEKGAGSAAGGVAASGTQWPDLIVAALLSGLFLQSAGRILSPAKEELRSLRALPQPNE